MLQRTLGRAATLPLIRRPRSTSPGARRARGEGGSNLKTRRRPMANKATGGHKVTRRQVLKGAVGRKFSRQGVLPFKVQYVDNPESKKFAKDQTRWATAIPTVYNADTLGIRPDLVKRPIEHWHELLNPEFKGRSAILDVPSIGIMDAAMAIESRGDVK